MAFLATERDGERSGDDAKFELVTGETTIGRHPDCGIVVDAGAVSRMHAKVISDGTGHYLEDMSSRNGTFLNGQLISGSALLKEGDRIRISDVEFVFDSGKESENVPDLFKGAEACNGTKFGVMMYDENETAQLSGSGSAKVEYRSSADGLKMSATPEAKLEALMQINRNLGNVLAVDEVLPKVLESLFDIFPSADRGFVVMVTDSGDLIPRWVKTRGTHDETETLRISRTIIREVMSTGEAILSIDASDDERFDSSQSIADFSIRSMICAPLKDADGNAFGALQIDSTQGGGQFMEEDTDLLSGVAAQAGIVINNARMHEAALKQKEVQQDLKLATEVQQAFLPDSEPVGTGYRVSSFYQAANHIGGDYFDYVEMADGRIGVVVADVVGHGVAAAMFMAKLSAETRFCLAREPDVAKAIEQLNDRMSRLQVERFITFLLVVIDPASDCVTIVNAGHMAPVIRAHQDGAICEPGEEESGLPIAIDSGMDYEAVQHPMNVGDLAVLYTDGIDEAMDANDQLFGIERVRQLTAQGGDAETVKERIVSEVRSHIGDAPPFDDMCLVVIERMEKMNAEQASNEQASNDESEAIEEVPAG